MLVADVTSQKAPLKPFILPQQKLQNVGWPSALASPAMEHWGTALALPTANNLVFSVNFRAAQSLTATLCGCLSKRILYSATAASVSQWTLLP